MENRCRICRKPIEYDELGIGYCQHCKRHVCNHTIRWVIFRPRNKRELVNTIRGTLASEAGTKPLATAKGATELLKLMGNFFDAVKGARIILPSEKGFEKGGRKGVAELAALNGIVVDIPNNRDPELMPSVNTFTAFCRNSLAKKKMDRRSGLLLKPAASQYWQSYERLDDGKWIIAVYFDTDINQIVVDWQNVITPASILKLIKDGVPTDKIF